MRFKIWLTEAVKKQNFTNLSTSILASFFEGNADLPVLRDSLLDNGQDDIANLVTYALETMEGGSATGRITDRRKIIEFNSIFRKYYLGFRRLFKPDRWRVDGNTPQSAGYVASVRETGKEPTRKGGVQWPYQSVTYALHRGDVGVMRNTGMFHNYTVGRPFPSQIPEYRELLLSMQQEGIPVWPLGDTSKPSKGEIVTQSNDSFTYIKDLHVSEFPEGMIWRAFLTMLAPYGSRDLIRLIGTAH